MINGVTNVLGVAMILAAPYSVFILDKVLWSDAIWGVIGGISLIYTKNASLVDKVLKVFNKKIE